MLRRNTRLLGLAAFPLITMLAACSPPPGGPTPDDGRLVFYANVAGTSITAIVVEVTGEGIDSRLVFNIEVGETNIASDTLTVPAGPDRVFTAVAHDGAGVETHRGQASTQVRPGTNPPLTIQLMPLTGDVPIEVIMGTIVVIVQPDTATLEVGDTLRLGATVVDVTDDGTDAQIEWATRQPALASITAEGLVTAILIGGVEIVATYRGARDAAAIQVTPPPMIFVSVLPDTSLLAPADTVDLVVTVSDANGNEILDAEVIWESDNPVIALVEPRSDPRVAKVTAGTDGIATITARSGATIATATIIVASASPASIEVSPAADTIVVGSTLRLTATVRDSGGNVLEDAVAAWVSSDPALATINPPSGPVTTLTGQAAGIVKIIASSGVFSDTATVMIDPTPVASVAISLGANTVEIEQTIDLVAVARDAAGNELTDRGISWESSDPSAASINPTSGPQVTVTGIFPDTVTISATVEDVDGSVSITVTPIWTAISADDAHTCALRTAGEAYCWGANDSGQLGIRSVGGNVNSPTLVAGDTPFEAITTGQEHTCALDFDNVAHCWGRNDRGQLGNATTNPSAVPTRILFSTNNSRAFFSSLSAGSDFTCGMGLNSQLYCWGDNSRGQLGDGDGGFPEAMSTRPSPEGPPFINFNDVSAGGQHACAYGVTAFCWGDNDSLKLGTDSIAGGARLGLATSPVQVVNFLSVTDVATGDQHSCGLRTTLEEVWCWGDNHLGQLGDGLGGGPGGSRLAPGAVAGNRDFEQLSAGGDHTCAIEAHSNGTLLCWGKNDFGQLGSVSAGTCSGLPCSTAPIAIAGTSFVAVNAGANHTCGIGRDGYAYCWGSNSSGQLGDGTLAGKDTPVRVQHPDAIPE